MLTQKTFKGSAVSLNYMESPSGGPALLLLHGITQRWQAFVSILPQLTLAYHVFAPDFRGHGLSGRVKDGYRGEDYSHDIIEFIEQVIKEPTIIFGHSLGGMISVYVAGCRPDLVRALIVGDVWFFSGNVNRSMYVEMFQKTLALVQSSGSYEELRHALPEMTLHSPVYGDVAMKSLPKFDEPYLNAWARSLSQLDPETLSMTLERRGIEGWRPEEFLRNIKCPTLLMQADPKMGGLMSDDDVKRARELLEDSQYVRMEGIGHSLQMSEATPVLRVLGNFLGSLE